MALGDFTVKQEGAFGSTGSQNFNVLQGTLNSIKAGDMVSKILKGTSVLPLANAQPVLSGTQWGAYVVGLATSTSTDTTTGSGVVVIMPMAQGTIYLVNADVAATWNTQSKYDLLVGSRVTLARSATGVYTINATDNADNGCIVEPLEIAKYPGKVAFSFRTGTSYLAI